MNENICVKISCQRKCLFTIACNKLYIKSVVCVVNVIYIQRSTSHMHLICRASFVMVILPIFYPSTHVYCLGCQSYDRTYSLCAISGMQIQTLSFKMILLEILSTKRSPVFCLKSINAPLPYHWNCDNIISRLLIWCHVKHCYRVLCLFVSFITT